MLYQAWALQNLWKWFIFNQISVNFLNYKSALGLIILSRFFIGAGEVVSSLILRENFNYSFKTFEFFDALYYFILASFCLIFGWIVYKL